MHYLPECAEIYPVRFMRLVSCAARNPLFGFCIEDGQVHNYRWVLDLERRED